MEWWDHVGRHSRVYEFRPQLGRFLIPERMLRAGGSSEELQLQPYVGARALRSQPQYFELPEEKDNRIKDVIKHVFND